MGVLGWVVAVVVLAALAVVAAGQVGAFAGRAPQNLGVRDARLKPPSKTPNSVSSQAALWPDHPRRSEAQIAPIGFVAGADGAATLARIAAVVEAMPGARIVERRPDYLYAQFTTRVLGFVDDTEFWVDAAAGVVQVRSASRVGRRDFEVNRQRIETIRARLAAAGG